jgi:arabinogalactan endo-1,4-beta-galactosidase
MNKIVLLYLTVFFQFAVIAQDKSISFIRGVDISSAPQIEDAGGQYRDSGKVKDVLDIFKEYGVNYVRLRLWNAPSDGYCGLTKTLDFAKRIKEKGFRLLLDIHYSDSWADPGQQTKPSAWTLLPYNILEDSVYQYTKDVINALKNQGTIPEMVQIGNEITNGMLWPDGKNTGSTDAWTKFADLVKKGIQGVRDASDTNQVRIIIHIDKGGDNQTSRWFFDNLLQQGVQFDIIGLSYYPWWHGTFTQLRDNINDLSVRYNKNILIVETAYPWTSQTLNDGYNNVGFDTTNLPQGYPVSFQGQKDYLAYFKQLIKNSANGKCIGFFYWEPAYISVPPIGSPWENYTLFDFNGNAMNSIIELGEQDSDSVTTVNVAKKVRTSTGGDEFKLYQNYPNPFNPVTHIKYTVPLAGIVTLKVYDILGREIATLINTEKAPGRYDSEFDASKLSSGIYYYTLKTNEFLSVKKMVLIK